MDSRLGDCRGPWHLCTRRLTAELRASTQIVGPAAPVAYKRGRGEGALRFKTSFRNTIYDVMKRRGWKETDRHVVGVLEEATPQGNRHFKRRVCVVYVGQ